MILELMLALIFGCLAGTFTGLAPGIHINLISLFLVEAYYKFNLNPLFSIIFIVSMSITHTFIDFIPSIFLGAPDEDSIFSVLPGHRFLLKGRAFDAIVLTLKGGLNALIIIILLIPLFLFIIPKIYSSMVNLMGLILIIISLLLIFSEKNKIIYSLIFFLLSGFLGFAVLNLGLKNPLLPLLTGLFGTSNMLLSIKQKPNIPKQIIKKTRFIRLKNKSYFKTIMILLISTPLTSFLPGMGSSQTAVISKQISGKLNTKEFLFLIGAINTIVMGLSFIALYSLNKTRTGSAAAISQIINISAKDLLIIILVIIISGMLAYTLALYLSKIASKNIHKINYTKFSKIVLIFLVLITIYFSGILGLLILIISTSLGISASLSKIKKMYLMGCLLIPTIIHYLI